MLFFFIRVSVRTNDCNQFTTTSPVDILRQRLQQVELRSIPLSMDIDCPFVFNICLLRAA